MPTKEQRSRIASDHLARTRGLFAAETQASIDAVKIYEDGEGRELELGDPAFDNTVAVTAWKPILDAIAQASGRVCVVDPANFTRAGGNFENGAWDPESQICSQSNLYLVLKGLERTFHKANKHFFRGGLASDRAMFIPDVVFTAEGVMATRDVIVISPVNRKMALENHRSEAECDHDFANRIETIMRIAAANGVETLVVGDFGCGYMGNDPSVVAGLFSKWIEEHPGQIKRVVFAIGGGPSLDAFREVFPEEERPVVESAESTEEVEEDDFEIDVEPVEDGRWVFD